MERAATRSDWVGEHDHRRHCEYLHRPSAPPSCPRPSQPVPTCSGRARAGTMGLAIARGLSSDLHRVRASMLTACFSTTGSPATGGPRNARDKRRRPGPRRFQSSFLTTDISPASCDDPQTFIERQEGVRVWASPTRGTLDPAGDAWTSSTSRAACSGSSRRAWERVRPRGGRDRCLASLVAGMTAYDVRWGPEAQDRNGNTWRSARVCPCCGWRRWRRRAATSPASSQLDSRSSVASSRPRSRHRDGRHRLLGDEGGDRARLRPHRSADGDGPDAAGALSAPQVGAPRASRGLFMSDVLLVGHGRTGAELVRQMRDDTHHGMRIVGRASRTGRTPTT